VECPRETTSTGMPEIAHPEELSIREAIAVTPRTGFLSGLSFGGHSSFEAASWSAATEKRVHEEKPRRCDEGGAYPKTAIPSPAPVGNLDMRKRTLDKSPTASTMKMSRQAAARSNRVQITMARRWRNNPRDRPAA